MYCTPEKRNAERRIWSIQVASHWQGPHLLKIVVLAMADVSLVFRGQSTLTSYSSLLNPPLSTSLISLTVVKHHVYLEEYIILNRTYHP